MDQLKTIGLVLNELRKERKVSVVEISDQLGLTRQGIYDTFGKRVSMPLDEIKRWADVLGVNSQIILDRMEGKRTESTNKSADNGSFGSEVLQNIQKLLEEEIKEKNEQIRALQEALKESQQMAKALLGKSREYPYSAIAPNFLNGGFRIRK